MNAHQTTIPIRFLPRNTNRSKYGVKIQSKGGFLFARRIEKHFWNTLDGKPSNVQQPATT